MRSRDARRQGATTRAGGDTRRLPPGRARRVLGVLLGAVRQIVGAPDYQRYVAHHAARHPGRPPLSPREYYAEFLSWQFGSGGPTRCC